MMLELLVCPFLQEKPPLEENDKNYEDEETVKKWNHIEINDAKGKDEIDNLFDISENFFLLLKLIKFN